MAEVFKAPIWVELSWATWSAVKTSALAIDKLVSWLALKPCTAPGEIAAKVAGANRLILALVKALICLEESAPIFVADKPVAWAAGMAAIAPKLIDAIASNPKAFKASLVKAPIWAEPS